MTFPSSSGSTNSMDVVWLNVRTLASTVKNRSSSLSAASAAGNITAFQVLDFTTFLADATLQFNVAAGITGLAAYAQAQISNASENISTDFSTMMTAINNVISWAVANLPASGGFLQAVSIQASGRYVWAAYTPAQTATFRTQLDALTATID